MSKKTYNLMLGDCCKLIKEIPDESIDAIITDPPYLYLKKDKRMPHINFDNPFDEELFFQEAKRVLKPTGFLVYFGRGASFYRWGHIAGNLGFYFKEEVIWNKLHTKTPLNNFSRMHETIAIWVKKENTALKKARFPYKEKYGIDNCTSLTELIKAINNLSKNTEKFVKSFHNEKDKDCFDIYLKENINKNVEDVAIPKEVFDTGGRRSLSPSISTKFDISNKDLYQLNTIIKGIKEQSIIDCLPPSIPSIWEQAHMKNVWHPTEKPTPLMERLIALVTAEGDMVLDTFMGSGTTGVACKTLGRSFIGMELNPAYYQIAKLRVEKSIKKNPYQKTARRRIEDYCAFLESLSKMNEDIIGVNNKQEQQILI